MVESSVDEAVTDEDGLYILGLQLLPILMPGVTILPNNSSGSGLLPSSHNGSHHLFDKTPVADIKLKAKEAVNREARGASAITLIKTARAQILSAKEHEANGDLRNALASFIKAATLAKMTLDSTEYGQEAKGKGGVLRKEVNDFLEHDGHDINARVNALEEKLKAIEVAQPTSVSDVRDAPVVRSIADRLRALQNSGLSVGQTKLREATKLPTPPVSPGRFPTGTQYNHSPSPSGMTPSNSTYSTHTFVSPSTLGPPSPSSTSSSSPPSTSLFNDVDLTGFSQAFPTIDELDEHPSFSLPSVPTGIGVSKPYSKDLRNADTATTLFPFRNFTVPIERPSSTPITHTNNNLNSQPPSPNKSTVPLKASGLSNGVTASSSTPKVPIPVKNIAFPNDLLSYIRNHNVLLIDIRNRVDFEREHIKANAVICIEPSILMREGVTAETIENAMVIAPRQEASLFDNRDKFDLVAVYDGSSTSFGDENTPLSTLVRVISEQAFRKMLKRMPMLLVGGIAAWKREVGETELIRGTLPLEIQRPIPTKDLPNSLLTSNSNGTNLFLNGTGINPNNTGNVADPHEVWTPRQKPEGPTMNGSLPLEYRLDHPGHSRSPADAVYTGVYPPNGDRPIIRRPPVLRPSSSSISFTRSLNDTITSPVMSAQSMTNGSPISYPQFSSPASPPTSGYGGSFTSPPGQYDIASPPQASINPSQLSRRRSDFVDQSQEALSGFIARGGPIDYPELTSPTIVRPPPVAASTMERHDNRPRVQQVAPSFTQASLSATGPTPPRIPSDYPVNYWFDIEIGTSGLKNLGNTCYMNAPIQCLSATVPFSRFFTENRWKNAINYTNPLGSKGKLTGAFAKLLHEMWGGDLPYLTPIEFRRSICQLKSQYNGSDQHDSQEFLSFLIDGIHEDLNRIMVKPSYSPTPAEEAEIERLPPQIASDREWRNWRSRNDSLIVDFFQGQFRNRLECLTCHKTSTTYNVFSILQLPVPNARSGKVAIERCLDAFFDEEILERDDAWDCPRCKVKRRASKKLSLARLPPVLMVHFKRFEANGRFSDKIDTFVDFPMKSLDLTNYMPPPLPPGADRSQLNGGLPMSLDDPRSQLPPYRYDLYGVTNHYGNLSSGHYTAFIASRGGWMYCDDSSVKPVDSKQVVGQKAYVLFYKRVRP